MRAIAWALALQAGLPLPVTDTWPTPAFVFFTSFAGAVTLGILSLLANSFLSPDAQVRRKARVMMWGTTLGTAPVTVVAGLAFVGGFKRLPIALWQFSVLLLSTLWPL